MKKRILFLFCMTVFSSLAQNTTDLSVSEFSIAITKQNSYLLDVRTPEELIGGYIEGAHFLNYLSPTFEKDCQSLPKDKTIYVYCRSGNRSGKALAFLKNKGYSNVFHLTGGIKAWTASAKPLVKK